MKSEIAIAAMIASVCAAFFDCGRLNALTPFEIDSTPVSAAEPEANARRTSSSVTAPVPAATGCGTAPSGRCRRCISRSPVASTRVEREHEAVRRQREQQARLAHAAQVGDREQRGCSASESQTRYGWSDGAADVIARIPAATDTATVRM